MKLTDNINNLLIEIQEAELVRGKLKLDPIIKIYESTIYPYKLDFVRDYLWFGDEDYDKGE